MFRTEISVPASPNKIDLTSPILTIGSCFSDCMGQRLETNKFKILSNPFGTVYNPISIFELLLLSIKNDIPDENTYIQTQGLWANYLFHSRFNNPDKILLQKQIKESIIQTHQFLKTCKHLIITFGTSFVYKKNDDQLLVANCHKVPAKNFNKTLLTQKQIIEAFENLYKELNQDLNIILTVSPVRHIKDGIADNQVSKSILRITCDTLSKEYSNVHYFPSFEIMMDDLRDYRFYKSDLIHPTTDAEDYIWQKFGLSYFDKEILEFIESWQKILKAINHRPFNVNSDNHQKFVKETISKLRELEDKIDISSELKQLQNQLNQ